MSEGDLAIRLAGSVGTIPSADWDALNPGGNPFTSHRFLDIMEQSGSVGPGTGWAPAPLILGDGIAPPRAALPAYLKSHSQGEYVFDHGWADAWERAGGSYYPKLQISVPFTPATGPRVLAASEDDARIMLRGAEALVSGEDLSSAHATFIMPDQIDLFREAGWLIRQDIQFHWTNRGFQDFEAFLATLASRKRKAIRKERARAIEGLRIEHLSGDALKPEHWDAFWLFYQDTGARKWGHPYLTREAFDLFGSRMKDDVVLILAFEDDMAVAGALNFAGPQALYGRYWGALVDRPFLHFELCYYQAIDAAIARGLQRVEAGAQGSHKLARGYEPVTTYSAHFIPHEGFRAAVADYLDKERAGIDMQQNALQSMTPFRRG
ncbi:GNAT family N-acetyltransferase [Croceicoccus marinus]|uniref:GNAT family N-acetyltransferase n=1 Tax=Croceicoccus marinus TaxID=450378 RepID=A0A1Z1F800_9SPHN|nr:GNAT family N-acetyltransferase [Croceicoccus marinus]ARU14929.1 GNAT family N-acetyltransferase [Croceicoccus marinus]